jgi:hypothetical protein
VAAPASVPQPAEVGQDHLRRFRTDFYDCLTARPDGLFELLDGEHLFLPSLRGLGWLAAQR